MRGLVPSELLLFGDFRLDRRGGLFRRDDNGGFAPIAIGSRGLDILGVLIERAGEVVSKDEIIAAVWPETVVEDSNLTVQISTLRRVLDRGRSTGSCIQTIPGRGYRFIAPVGQPNAVVLPASLRNRTSAASSDDRARTPHPAPRPRPAVSPRSLRWTWPGIRG